MISNIKDYTPDELQFVLSPTAKEKFPLTLFDGAASADEVIEEITKNFVAIFPDAECAVRKYDEHEISEIREEYCIKQENEISVRIEELANAIENAKRIKKDAEDRLAACQQEIRDLAAKVKDGTTSYQLPSTSTVRFALCGYYLFYAWIDGKFQLVKADKIPEWDKRSLWAQDDKNRTAMFELFGLEFPDVERPANDIDEDMPFGEE